MLRRRLKEKLILFEYLPRCVLNLGAGFNALRLVFLEAYFAIIEKSLRVFSGLPLADANIVPQCGVSELLMDCPTFVEYGQLGCEVVVTYDRLVDRVNSVRDRSGRKWLRLLVRWSTCRS